MWALEPNGHLTILCSLLLSNSKTNQLTLSPVSAKSFFSPPMTCPLNLPFPKRSTSSPMFYKNAAQLQEKIRFNMQLHPQVAHTTAGKPPGAAASPGSRKSLLRPYVTLRQNFPLPPSGNPTKRLDFHRHGTHQQLAPGTEFVACAHHVGLFGSSF